jgi:hypothetical protein
MTRAPPTPTKAAPAGSTRSREPRGTRRLPASARRVPSRGWLIGRAAAGSARHRVVAAAPAGPAACQPANGEAGTAEGAVAFQRLHRVLRAARGEPAHGCASRAHLALVDADGGDQTIRRSGSRVCPAGTVGRRREGADDLGEEQEGGDQTVAVERLGETAPGLQEAGVPKARATGPVPVARSRPPAWAAVAAVSRVVPGVVPRVVVRTTTTPGHGRAVPGLPLLTPEAITRRVKRSHNGSAGRITPDVRPSGYHRRMTWRH